MSYNEINREGLEQEVGRKLTDEEFAIFQENVARFIESAFDSGIPATQEEVDEFIENHAFDVAEW